MSLEKAKKACAAIAKMPKSTNPLLQRRKSASASPLKRQAFSMGDAADVRLDDNGLVPSLAPSNTAQDVISLIRYVQANIWSAIPERASGMGSERISEVLRFRDSLPKIVSLAHLYSLSKNSTNTERELARLVTKGELRRVNIAGRGKGGGRIGEGVVLTSDWIARVTEEQGLEEEVRGKYVKLLHDNPASSTVSTAFFTPEQVRQLVSYGFLTSATGLASSSTLFTPPTLTTSLSQSGFKSATGTLAAVGGRGAIHESGGSGSTLFASGTPVRLSQQTMTFSLPSTGPYLKLLTSARLHLLHLLKTTSPRYKETTISLLKEKWDGNLLNEAKRARGEWAGLREGKTKKWKEFWGLEFEWVLEECVGSGVVEVFETGVGVWGVRAT